MFTLTTAGTVSMTCVAAGPSGRNAGLTSLQMAAVQRTPDVGISGFPSFWSRLGYLCPNTVIFVTGDGSLIERQG